MKKNDVFGQILLDYFKGRKVKEIIERDDGYVDINPHIERYFSDYKEWPKYEKKAINFAEGKILDIGCGAGRHSLYLQKKGFYVVGIDISPLAIKICKLRGLKNTKIMSINQVGKFRSNSFDTIIMMDNNFGLFGSFDKAKRLLKKFYKITSKSALIIAETTDPLKIKNPKFVQYCKLNIKKGKMYGQMRIRIRYKKMVGKWFDYLFASKMELKEILKNTGWKVKKIIDSENLRYIIIIKKLPQRLI